MGWGNLDRICGSFAKHSLASCGVVWCIDSARTSFALDLFGSVCLSVSMAETFFDFLRVLALSSCTYREFVDCSAVSYGSMVSIDLASLQVPI